MGAGASANRRPLPPPVPTYRPPDDDEYTNATNQEKKMNAVAHVFALVSQF